MRKQRTAQLVSRLAFARVHELTLAGTSFDLHVMAGYRFLMRYYTPGDDIYFFGFSRGAYTARFLAEMLDHVGLLSVSASYNLPQHSFPNQLLIGWQRRNVPICVEVSSLNLLWSTPC